MAALMHSLEVMRADKKAGAGTNSIRTVCMVRDVCELAV